MRTMSRRDMYLAKRITMQMGNVSAAMKPITSTRDRGGAVIEKGAIVKADGNQGKVTAITSDDGIIAVEVLIKGRKVIYGPGQLTVITTARPDVSAATLVKFICADRNTANRLARQALAAKVPGLRVDGDTGVMVPQKSVNALKKVADQEGITVTQQGGNVSASALDFELITKMITGNQRASEIADYYSDRVGFSERQWDMLVDGRYSKLFDLRDPMSKLKLVQAMSKMRNVTLPPELSGKKPPTVSASVTQPRMRAYDFSFSNDLDRELFITEVEAMRFPAGTKPPHLETWNASATVWANDPRVVAAAQRIARGYYGVKMSNALPVSAAGKITKFMGKNAPKLVRYTIKKTGEGDELVVKFFTTDGQHYEPADYFTDDKGDAKSTGDDVIKRNAAMSNVSASLAPAAMGSLDLTLPSAAHAQRFAAAAMKLGTKVQYEGSRVRCSYDHKHGPALMSLASQAHRGQVAAAVSPEEFKQGAKVYSDMTEDELRSIIQGRSQLPGRKQAAQAELRKRGIRA